MDYLNIRGPNHNEALWIALDIGGTLTKVVCIIPKCFERQFSHLEDSATHEIPLDPLLQVICSSRQVQVPTVTSNLLVKTYLFSSRDISTLIDTLHDILNVIGYTEPSTVRVTGGGALKFADVLKSKLNITVSKVEEMTSLVTGLGFVLTLAKSSVRYDPSVRMTLPLTSSSPTYPFLLVSIGSGVSILRLDSPTDYKRVSGTAIGGGTALGLGKLLLGCDSFQSLIDLSKCGESSRVDSSVGDLMGFRPDSTDSTLFPSDTLAASLGKVGDQPRREDLAQSLIRMTSYNIGYIACLVARIQNIRKIYFSGKFVHKHEPTMQAIAYAVDFYKSTWEAEARFLLHEGFIGALGALISE